MNGPIFIHFTAEITSYFSFLKKEFSSLKSRKFFYDIAAVDSYQEFLTSDQEILFVEYSFDDKYKNLIDDIINSSTSPIYLLVSFSNLSKLECEQLVKVGQENQKIEGLLDISLDSSLHLPFFRSLMKKVNGNITMATVSKELNKILNESLAELQRVKKIHDLMVPMRNEKMKGVKVISKYAAGESSGGDFFDIIPGDQSFLLLLTSSSSYVASSVVLSRFEQLKVESSYSKEKFEEFLSSLFVELKKLDLLMKGKETAFHVLLLNIDLKRLCMNGHCFGNIEFVSNNGNNFVGNDYLPDKPFMDKAYIEMKLNRGEKLVVLSPGVRKNSKNLLDGREFTDFFNENFSKGPKELLNETFYQLKRYNKGDFLKHDASAIYIEVDTNVKVLL